MVFLMAAVLADDGIQSPLKGQASHVILQYLLFPFSFSFHYQDGWIEKTEARKSFETLQNLETEADSISFSALGLRLRDFRFKRGEAMTSHRILSPFFYFFHHGYCVCSGSSGFSFVSQALVKHWRIIFYVLFFFCLWARVFASHYIYL